MAIGGGFLPLSFYLGYLYYDNWQKEKMWEEEYQLQEEQRQQQEEQRQQEEAKQLEIETAKRAEVEQIQREAQQRLQQKQSEIRHAFYNQFVGKTLQSSGWANSYSGDNTIYEFWRITFIDKNDLRFEIQKAESYYQLKDDNWQTMATAPYSLEFDLEENKYSSDEFSGKCKLISDGYEGELTIYKFRDPIKISDSFTLVKGQRKLNFYKH